MGKLKSLTYEGDPITLLVVIVIDIEIAGYSRKPNKELSEQEKNLTHEDG